MQWGQDRTVPPSSSVGVIYTTPFSVPFSAPAFSITMSRITTVSQTYNQKHYVQSYIPYAATSLTPGLTYMIASLGTTNWQAIGAPTGATVGTIFTVTSFATGTGTATISNTDQFQWQMQDDDSGSGVTVYGFNWTAIGPA